MEQRTIESFFFLVLLIGTLVVVGFMFWPFFNVLFLAAILAFLLSGINERLAQSLGNRTAAALLTTFIALVGVLLPLALLIWQALQEAGQLYTYLQAHATADSVIAAFHAILSQLGGFAPWLAIDQASLTTGIQSILQWIVGQTGTIFVGIGNILLDASVMLFVLFFFLRDSKTLQRRAMDLSPLSDTQENQIIDKVTRTVSATVRGKILIGFLQGIIAGIGFWIFGVPAPALWGSAVVLASFVPTIGTALIAIPLIIYLFITSTASAAIGLTLWSGVIVSLLDNFLGPRLMAKGTQVHPLLMFLAVLGGLAMFGPIGVLLGPVIIAIMYALFEIYLSLVGVKPSH